MQREELLESKSYWVASIQLELYNAMEAFMKKNNLNKTQLAEKLNFSKGYISQVLNGDFDHKLSKMVDLSLSCNTIPLMFFVDKDAFVKNDSEDKTYELKSVSRFKNIFEIETENITNPIELNFWKGETKNVGANNSMSFVLGGNITKTSKKVS